MIAVVLFSLRSNLFTSAVLIITTIVYHYFIGCTYWTYKHEDKHSL